MFNLSRSQEIIWLHEELFPDSHAYNFTAVLELRGPLDEAALHDSLAEVVARHDAFRLELLPDGMPPRQRVRTGCPPRYRRVDLSADPEPERAFTRLVTAQHDDPFVLTEAPLVRWCLVRLGERHHRLVQTEHHLVHDGWSFGIILRDLFTLYRGRTSGVPATLPAPRSYLDHVRQPAAGPITDGGARRRAAIEYWRAMLDGAVFDLPLRGRVHPDRIREAPIGAQLRQEVEPELAERLRACARQDGHTPYSVLLTLYAELMRRHCGQDDLVIGSAVGNRPAGFGETVGMFVNTIPLRIHLQPDAPALDAVDDTTDVLFRALPHQDIPVQDLARELGNHSRTGLDNPLFRVMLSAHDAALPVVDGLDLDVSIYEAFNSGTSRFDLDVVLLPDSRRTVNPRTGLPGLTLIWDYATDLFQHADVEALAAQLVALLRDYLDNPSAPLAGLA